MVVEQVGFFKFQVSASKHVHEQSFRIEDNILKPWLNYQTFLHNTKCWMERFDRDQTYVETGG